MATTPTRVPPRVNIKIRQPDHDAIKRAACGMPVATIDVVSAWRLLWEATPPKKQFDFLRRVHALDGMATAVS